MIHISTLFAQWDPYAGVVPSLTEGAVVYTSSGIDGADVVDNDENTAWQTGFPYPTNFFGRPELNILLNGYFNGQCSNSEGISCTNAHDANLTSNVNFAVSGNQAWMRFDFDNSTSLRTISLKGNTIDPIYVYGHLSNGDSTLITVYESANNFSLKRYPAVLDSVVAIKLNCMSAFTVFEIGALAGYPVEYAIVDMGQLRSIGYIDTRHWADGGTVATRILVSADSVNWTLVGVVNPDALFKQTTRLEEPVLARYIKVEHWLDENDFSKANIWEVDAYDEFGPYGPMTPPVQSPTTTAEIMGINGLWGWGHGIYSNSLASGEGPGKFSQVASHARSYHNLHWDVADPDDVPDYSKMDTVPSSLALWWLDWDREYQAWVDAGLKVHVTVKFNQGINPMSNWDDPFLAAFQYGYSFARHFGPTHGNNLVEAFEVGNEPWDYPASFYREVLRGMTLGAKIADPDFFVMPCALQAAFPHKEYGSGGNFMGARLSEDVAPYIDAINVHHYSYTYNEEGIRIAVHPEHPESEMRAVINDIRFRDVNLPGKKVYLSEWGWDSNGAGEDCTFGECVSEHEQAIYAVRGAMMFIRLGVDKLSWYFFGNESSGGLYSRSGLVGHGSANFAEKRSFKSFQAFVNLLGDRYFLDTLREDDQAWVYLFGDSAGKPTHLAAWRPVSGTDSSFVEIDLPIDYRPDAAWTIAGNSATGSGSCLPDYEDGEMKLRISAVPLIIKLAPDKGTTITWVGSTSNNWHNESNWDPPQVPTLADDVLIPSGTDNRPVSFNADLEARSLKIKPGAYITLNPGYNLNVARSINLEGSLFVSGVAGLTPDISFGSNWKNTGAFVPGAGKVIVTGEMHQCVYGENTFRNLELRSGSRLSLIDETGVTGVLSVKTGSVLETNDRLTLESSASIMHGENTPFDQEGTVIGKATVKRIGSTNPLAYNYWSSPVADEGIEALGNAVYYYNPTFATDTTGYGMRRGWVRASGTLDRGKGYISKDANTVYFFGDPNNAPVSNPIFAEVKKNAGTANNVSYNLIGNPFPSALDAFAFMDANGPNGAGKIAGAIYLWDDDGSGGSNWNASEDYITWTGAGSVTGYNNHKVFDGFIGSGQSFFVEKINNGVDSVVFDNTMRSTRNNVFFRQAPIERLWLSVVNPDNDYNETLVAFIPDATDDLDLQYDARKLQGNPDLALYSKIDKRKYAIQALAPLTVDKTVPIGLDAGVAGNYTIELKLVENIDETVVILLEDKEMDVFHNLRMNPYSFNANAMDYDERFFLHFNPPMEITTLDQNCEGVPGEIMLEQNGNQHWSLTLLDELDNVIAFESSFDGNMQIGNLATGSYTLQLTDTFGYEVIKTITLGAKERVVADFECDDNHVTVNKQITFKNLSVGATEYEWDFGNGFHSFEAEPVYQYHNPGVYDIILRAFNSDCRDDISKTIIAGKEAATGIAADPSPYVFIFGSEDKIFVSFNIGQITQAHIIVYDIMGRQIINESAESIGLYSFSVDHPGNIFLVKVMLEKEVYSAKVLL